VGKLQQFFKESYQELTQKVSWAKYSTLQAQATLVLIASLIFAGIISLVDLAFKVGLEALYDSLR
jgi:preprotein translocase subunit SecE